MTIQEIFKTLEGIVVLSAFTLIVITGSSVFAMLGLIMYILVNIKNGMKLLKGVSKKIVSLFKSFKK